MKDKNKIRKIVFWIIILIGIITRLIMWPNGLKEINCDEAMTAINASSIANTGEDIYGTSYPVYLEAWQYTGQSVMLAYIMAIFIKIFGASIFSVRLPLMIFSIISLFVMYDLCKRAFKNVDIALVILAILSICPWHIMQSKWSIDCNLFPHFMLIAVDLMFIGIKENRKVLYLSMIMFGLSMYTYGLSVFVVPLFLIILAIYLLVKKQVSIKEIIICIFIYTILSMPIALMYIINLFKLENINLGPVTIQYFENTVRADDMLIFSNHKLLNLVNNIKNFAILIFKQYDRLPWNEISSFGAIYSISMIFFLVGCIYLLKLYFSNKSKNEDFTDNNAICIILTWMIASIFLALNVSEININKINIIWYPMIILTGYGIYKICTSIKVNKKIMSTVILLMYIIMFTFFNYKYYTKHITNIESSFCWSNGLNISMQYAMDSDKKEIIIDKNVLENGACPIYVRYVQEFYKNKDCEYKDITNIEEDVVYILMKENMKEEFEEYKQLDILGYVVLYK